MQFPDATAESMQWYNRIPVRFAILFGMLGAFSAGAYFFALRVYAPDAAAGVPFIAVAIYAMALMGGVGVTYTMSNILSRRIEELTDAAAQIADGNLDTEVELECSCAVGGLAESMRKMVGKLRGNFESIQDLALFDPVSGLPNRNHLLRCLGSRLSGEKGIPCPTGALLYLDLNGFKKVNDTFGHAIGDKLLRAVAVRLLEGALDSSVEANKARALDPAQGCQFPVLARFGGDEFIIHIPDLLAIRDLGRMADRIRLLLTQPFDIDGRAVSVGTAIGLTRYPLDGSDADVLVRNADLAMYAAKNSGSSKIGVFEASMVRSATERRELERELKRAIRAGQLEVYYQPKVVADTEQLIGVEALVRWNHPDRGLLGPGTFIEIAELTGLIVELGNAVMDMAIQQCAAFARQGAPLNVAINVSLAQLEQEDFADAVLAMIAKHGAPSEYVTLEITETVASVNLRVVRDQMRTLRNAGIKFAIDDFGTGYSNLSQMLTLRFDELKIDRSLISDISANAQNRSIVEMIVAMAKNIGCRVLAEGVETRDQLECMRSIGCDEIQGFLFAKPMPVERLRAWRSGWASTHRADVAPPMLKVAS